MPNVGQAAEEAHRPRRLPQSANGAPIRVAFVGQAGVAGGAERTLISYFKYFADDISPSLILFEDGTFADEVRALAIPVEIVAAPASLISSTRERPRLDALGQGVMFAVRLAQRLRALRVEAVYSNTVKAHFLCAAAARLAGVPLIMHFHDLLNGKSLHALRLAARFGSAERIACAAIVGKAVGLDKTTVSYGPIVLAAYDDLPDRERARALLGLPHDIPLVSIVGRINRWKGHDRFIRIASIIRRYLPVHFAIVGAPIFRDADFVPELHELVGTLGLQNEISFVPWVDDVRMVYAATDVNVNCSTREPFGRSIPEAACAGIASVCFDDSGASETIVDRQTGRVVPAADENAFAAAIIDCLATARDPQRRDIIRSSARRFDAVHLSEDIAGVIRRVASTHTTRRPLVGSAR